MGNTVYYLNLTYNGFYQGFYLKCENTSAILTARGRASTCYSRVYSVIGRRAEISNRMKLSFAYVEKVQFKF